MLSPLSPGGHPDLCGRNGASRRGLLNTKDTSQGGGSHGVVEVLVVIVPLDGEVVLTTVLKRLVDWVQVLGAAHGGDPIISWIIGHWVLQVQADWVPHLAHFWVDGGGDVQIGIDAVEDVQVE